MFRSCPPPPPHPASPNTSPNTSPGASPASSMGCARRSPCAWRKTPLPACSCCSPGPACAAPPPASPPWPPAPPLPPPHGAPPRREGAVRRQPPYRGCHTASAGCSGWCRRLPASAASSRICWPTRTWQSSSRPSRRPAASSARSAASCRSGRSPRSSPRPRGPHRPSRQTATHTQGQAHPPTTPAGPRRPLPAAPRPARLIGHAEAR